MATELLVLGMIGSLLAGFGIGGLFFMFAMKMGWMLRTKWVIAFVAGYFTVTTIGTAIVLMIILRCLGIT